MYENVCAILGLVVLVGEWKITRWELQIELMTINPSNMEGGYASRISWLLKKQDIKGVCRQVSL